jgi:hypothetical protein
MQVAARSRGKVACELIISAYMEHLARARMPASCAQVGCTLSLATIKAYRLSPSASYREGALLIISELNLHLRSSLPCIPHNCVLFCMPVSPQDLIYALNDRHFAGYTEQHTNGESQRNLGLELLREVASPYGISVREPDGVDGAIHAAAVQAWCRAWEAWHLPHRPTQGLQ